MLWSILVTWRSTEEVIFQPWRDAQFPNSCCSSEKSSVLGLFLKFTHRWRSGNHPQTQTAQIDRDFSSIHASTRKVSFIISPSLMQLHRFSHTWPLYNFVVLRTDTRYRKFGKDILDQQAFLSKIYKSISCRHFSRGRWKWIAQV